MPQRYGTAPEKSRRVFVLASDEAQGNEIPQISRPGFEDGLAGADERVGPVGTDTRTNPDLPETALGDQSMDSLLGQLDRQTRRSDVLSSLTQLLASSLSLEEILDRVVARSTDVLGDTAFIVLNQDLGNQARAPKTRDQVAAKLREVVRRNPERIAINALAEVLSLGQPVVVWDYDDSEVAADTHRIAAESRVRSLLAVPIRTDRRILGAFVFMALAPHRLVETDLGLAAELSSFAAIAIENARLFTELQKTAITDPLTCLYNTRFFHELLSRETARADRFSTPLSLLMIDLDSFKHVNDTYGHVVGNKVLTSLGQILGECVRNTDFVFRCGGDEFGVVLPGTELTGAVLVAEKIRSRVERAALLTAVGYEGIVTLSIGVSQYQHKTHFETLVGEADRALYASKHASKNCVRASRGKPPSG